MVFYIVNAIYRPKGSNFEQVILDICDDIGGLPVSHSKCCTIAIDVFRCNAAIENVASFDERMEIVNSIEVVKASSFILNILYITIRKFRKHCIAAKPICQAQRPIADMSGEYLCKLFRRRLCTVDRLDERFALTLDTCADTDILI